MELIYFDIFSPVQFQSTSFVVSILVKCPLREIIHSNLCTICISDSEYLGKILDMTQCKQNGIVVDTNLLIYTIINLVDPGGHCILCVIRCFQLRVEGWILTNASHHLVHTHSLHCVCHHQSVNHCQMGTLKEKTNRQRWAQVVSKWCCHSWTLEWKYISNKDLLDTGGPRRLKKWPIELNWTKLTILFCTVLYIWHFLLWIVVPCGCCPGNKCIHLLLRDPVCLQRLLAYKKPE